MNIQPESSHHEQGPGQNEVDFRAAEALEAADNFVTFKWVVKSMASSSGLYASFLPKPLQNTPGSGLHLAVSITKNGQNLFHPSIEESEEGRQFVAGVLRRAAEMTIFGNPLTNSFQRLGEFEAPKYITWSHQNRAPLITVPLATGGKPQPLQAALVRRLHQSLHRIRPAHPRRSGRHRGQARACACVRGKPVHLERGGPRQI